MSAKFPRGGGGSRTFFSSKSIGFELNILQVSMISAYQFQSMKSPNQFSLPAQRCSPNPQVKDTVTCPPPSLNKNKTTKNIYSSDIFCENCVFQQCMNIISFYIFHSALCVSYISVL